MTFKETILEEVLQLFQAEGIENLTEDDIRARTAISQATYNELFADKEDLVLQVIRYDMQVQQDRKATLLKDAASAIDELLLLIQDGIANMKKTHPEYITDLQAYYPRVWQVCLDYLGTETYHQLYHILNRGVQSGHFRKDLNLELVTKITLEMLNMLINPQIFPPQRYNLPEVYRSIYLYYFRGLCTDMGARHVDDFFARNKL